MDLLLLNKPGRCRASTSGPDAHPITSDVGEPMRDPNPREPLITTERFADRVPADPRPIECCGRPISKGGLDHSGSTIRVRVAPVRPLGAARGYPETGVSQFAENTGLVSDLRQRAAADG